MLGGRQFQGDSSLETSRGGGLFTQLRGGLEIAHDI